MEKWREGGKIKKGRREKKREVEAEEKEGLQHKLIDMQSGCSSIRVHTLAKARTTDPRMPCLFTGPKKLCAGPNFLSQSKMLTAFSAS